ncbi:MAG TPA: TIGR01777 family oxidoreductase [Micromonosporaceae bacterium]
MRIVMAGSSGFLGTALRRRLTTGGHDVIQLVRREPTAPDQRRWNPDQGDLDPQVLAGAGAVINLAGAGVADKRWDAAFKATLVASRVDPTTTLARTMTALPAGQRPPVLINSSAVGYYGDTGDLAVDEDAPPGEGYFPELCQVWEKAADAASDAGVRVVKIRTGLVLDARGGLLKPLVQLFQFGLGGKIGDGRQFMPLISMHDWLAATIFVLDRADVTGPVNLVGPEPVRNADFTRALGRALHRPTVFPTPKFGVRLVLGEFGPESYASQRVLPGVLNRSGFTFRDGDLDAAIAAAL